MEIRIKKERKDKSAPLYRCDPWTTLSGETFNTFKRTIVKITYFVDTERFMNSKDYYLTKGNALLFEGVTKNKLRHLKTYLERTTNDNLLVTRRKFYNLADVLTATQLNEEQLMLLHEIENI